MRAGNWAQCVSICAHLQARAAAWERPRTSAGPKRKSYLRGFTSEPTTTKCTRERRRELFSHTNSKSTIKVHSECKISPREAKFYIFSIEHNGAQWTCSSLGP